MCGGYISTTVLHLSPSTTPNSLLSTVPRLHPGETVQHKVLPPWLALKHTEEGGPQGNKDGQHFKPLTEHTGDFGFGLCSQGEELGGRESREEGRGGEGRAERRRGGGREAKAFIHQL